MPNSGGQSIAEELASQQRQISVAEFFEQNRQMLGFGSKARSMVTAVKEGVDNAIDAAEDAGILPEVCVTIRETDDGYYALTIADNGPGITKEQVPKVFGKLLYGSRFATRVQRRGQQGIGISAAVMCGQLTTGKPAEITSKIKENDRGEYFKVAIDTDENEPEIRDSKSVDWEYDHESGTSITIYLDANFRARSSLHKYIEHTAVVNPHATIELEEPKKHVRYERTVEQLPEQPTEIKPHPHGIEFGTLRSLIEVTDSHSISGFLQSEFTRVGQTTADDIISTFMDRVDGRYCKWDVPGEDVELPVTTVTDGEPHTTHRPLVSDDEGSSESEGEDSTTETGVDRDRNADDDVGVETVTLEGYIADHVNRKGAEATTAFTTGVATKLREQAPVSQVTVRRVVEDVAEAVEKEHGKTFGDTVCEKSTTAAWEFIRTTREDVLTDLVDEATSDRKTDKDVFGFASTLCTVLDENSDGPDSFTHDELHRIVERTASMSADRIGNPFGETAQENVFNSMWSDMDSSPKEPPLLRELESDRDLADKLHNAMQETDVMAPPSHCLSPIGEDALKKGMKKVYDADFYTAATRDASAHSGEPFLVEAGIAHGGNIEGDGSIDLLRFANRVPLVYQQGACCITSVVSDIRWNNYNLSDKGNGLPQGPVALVVHVASTNVPFTSESKDAVASVEVIEDEIERAVREAARDLGKYLDKQRSLQKRRKKQDTIAQILPQFSKKISTLAGKSEPPVTKSLAQIMNNLLVVGTPDGNGSVTVTAANFDNQSTYTPTVTITTTTKPDMDGSLELLVEEADDGWEIRWEPTLTVDEESSVTLGVDASDIESIDVTGPPSEKVTTSLPQHAQV